MSGWISIHRKIQDHWLWDEKPFTRGQAWIDILLLVNHTDNKVFFDNEIILVKRGEHITSEPKLAERWGWSRTKVRNFLKLLEQDLMIQNKKEGRKRTRLIVLNYNDYQILENSEKTSDDTTPRQEKNKGKTREEQEEDINNNDNNDNNENNDNNTVCMYDENFKQITNIYSENIGQVLPIIGEQLKVISEEVPADLFKEAILIAVDRNKRYINYIEGILRNWKDAKINTLSDLEIFRREKELEREENKNKQIHNKSKSGITRFHNFEQRTDKYSGDEINKKVEDIAAKKRREYREKLKQQEEGGF